MKYHIVRTETQTDHYEVEADSQEQALQYWKLGGGEWVGEAVETNGPFVVDEKYITEKPE